MNIDNSDVIIRCQELKLTKLNRHVGVRQASCVETFTAGVYYPIKVPSSENAAGGLTKILKTKDMKKVHMQLMNCDIDRMYCDMRK